MKILIVSSEPALYRCSFHEVLHTAVLITDQASKAMALLQTASIDRLFIGYAQMANKWNDHAWSGQTFVRDLPLHTTFEHSRCYYLANDLAEGQKSWIVEHQHVAGVIGNSPLEISQTAFPIHFKDGTQQVFAAINQAFLRVAGPLGSIVISSVLPQLNSARAVSTSSYIKHLAGNIHIATQRQAFLAETGRVLGQRS